MKIYTILFALILLVTIPASIFAGDYAELDYIGVSKDGKYLAFEQYGVQDGSGFAYSNIYFINVAENKYAESPIQTLIENDSLTVDAVRAKSMKSAAAKLKKLRIIRGNTGKMVVARMLTDSVYNFDTYKDGGKTQTINFKGEVGSMYALGDYQLRLETFEVKDQKDYVDLPVYMLGLMLEDKTGDTKITLQKDSSLPKARGLPVGYAVQFIYLYDDKIITFLNVYTTGFEGPDMRYMVVTGKYK